MRELAGEVFSLEFRRSWKGFLIFLLVVGAVAGLMVQLFPEIEEEFEEEQLEGENLVDLEFLTEEEDNFIKLSWEWEWDNKTRFYRVYEDESTHMATSRLITSSENLQTMISHGKNYPENRYFGITAVMFDGSEMPVGMASNVEVRGVLEQMMDTPYFQMFAAGRDDLDLREIEGFLSVEFFSWFLLLVGLYLSYISVKRVAGDFDEKRMDLLFSTPMSRSRYMVEKFSVLSILVLGLLFFASVLISLSLVSIGELQAMGMETVFTSLLSSWPMFLVVISVSLFFSVLLKSTRSAMGLSFLFVVLQWSFNSVGNMVESLSFLKNYSIANYWDYNAVLLDETVKMGDFGLLVVVSLIILGFSIWIFKRIDF